MIEAFKLKITLVYSYYSDTVQKFSADRQNKK